MANINDAGHKRRPRPIVTPILYAVTSGFHPKRISNSPIDRGYKKDTLQHAALINIVAAVNKDVNYENGDASKDGSGIDFLNTQADISNLMKPLDRTVSIQTQHKTFNIPEKSVKKKPVYYKHSDDEEVVRSSHIRRTETGTYYNIKVKQTTLDETLPPSLEKSLPFKSAMRKSCSMYDTLPKALNAQSRSTTLKRDTMSCSTVRILGSLRRPESRKIHSVSKCDAVDLTDTLKHCQIDIKDPARAALDDTRKIIPFRVMPYFRAKSHPGIFSAKNINITTSKSSNARPMLLKSKLISRSKDIHDTMHDMILGMPGGLLVTSNGVNQDSDTLSSISQHSAKQVSPQISCNGIVTKKSRQRFCSTGASATSSQYLGSDNGLIYFQNKNTESSGELKGEFCEAVNAAMTSSLDLKYSFVSKVDNSEVLTIKSKNSCLSDKDPENQKPRHVEFAGEPNIWDIANDNNLTDEPVQRVDSLCGSIVIQTDDNMVRANFAGMQPMSVQELLRFKQKIIPANIPTADVTASSQPYFTTNSVVKMHTLQRKNISDAVPNSIGNENVKERDSDRPYVGTYMIKQLAWETRQNGRYSNTEVKESHKAEKDDLSDSGGVDESKPEFYKLVKAIDLHSYAGYEHKKIRKSSRGLHKNDNDTNKYHFVKVKLS